MTELLAPAGDEQSAYVALCAGADAIYLGLTQFSARQSAENFDVSALARVTRFAHVKGAKVYVCLNTLVKDSETAGFFESARLAHNAGADAILVQDIFLGKRLKEVYPELTLHLSTQAGCCNVLGAQLAKQYGFSRAVLARETPLSEIAAISKVIETEVFVQGALCTAFSGQCYFSSFAGNNSGNRGRCKQPCRKRYTIDRAGCEALSYALSPKDLSVGARVKELLQAGVTSLKIEGRLRRQEYVASAVQYYRALLAGEGGGEQLSRLKRAFNRGDYTAGLGFGQDGFLSRKVQGHIGEGVGTLTLRGGKYYCKSAFRPQKGDGFKILRGGKEVGGALFSEHGADGFYLSSSQKLAAGDEVRVTTDGAAASRALSEQVLPTVELFVRILPDAPMQAEGAGVCLKGETAQRAQRAPLTREDVVACFERTDGLPVRPVVHVETEGAFCPKSQLNAFRRAFYEALVNALAPLPEELPARPVEEPKLLPGKGGGKARICTPHAMEQGTMPAIAACPKDADMGGGELVIFKPNDYAHDSMPEGAYLYLPPFFTSADEAGARRLLESAAGFYGEGSYAILLAKKYQKPLFAGTGFNLTNRFAVAEVMAHARYFALSKEIAQREQDALATQGAFVLAEGAIKTMDLCYCPFERTCGQCDRRTQYTMTDEEGRAFPLRRYVAGDGTCRFEVYNCAALSAGTGLASVLADRTLAPTGGSTSGHSQRSML